MFIARLRNVAPLMEPKEDLDENFEEIDKPEESRTNRNAYQKCLVCDYTLRRPGSHEYE